MASGALSADHIGKEVVCSVAVDRRKDIERHHSGTHILHWALREVLGDSVRQTGSLVADTHFRFDFNYHQNIAPEVLTQIERLANQKIIENSPVTWAVMPFDQRPENAISFFSEKYGAEVRVVDIGGFSVELCGGTHVQHIGELGLLKIMSESSVSAGNRRIEAVAGYAALDTFQNRFDTLNQLSKTLSCKADEVIAKVQDLTAKRKSLEKQVQELHQVSLKSQADQYAQEAKTYQGVVGVIQVVSADNPNDLKTIAKLIFSKLNNGFVVLGCRTQDKVSIVSQATDAAIDKGIKANEIIQQLAHELDGRGGGKPNYAMGGGSKVQALSAAFIALETQMA